MTYYQGSWYYVKAGVVDWVYTGLCSYNGNGYYIKNGQVNWAYTGLCMYNNAWYYIKNGQVNWNYTGPCQYNGTYYYVENGVLNWSYDMSTDSGKTYASILVEPDVDYQEAMEIAQEKADQLESDGTQSVAVMMQTKQDKQEKVPELSGTSEQQTVGRQLETNWFVLVIKAFFSYLKECIGR